MSSSAKRILENKDSRSTLITSPLSSMPDSLCESSGSDFGSIHIPSVARIYPYNQLSTDLRHQRKSSRKNRNKYGTFLLLIWFGAGILFATIGFLFFELSRDFLSRSADLSESTSSLEKVGVENGKNGNSKDGVGGTCLSPICMQAASRLLSRIDTTHSPCDDSFYRYCCGNFIAKNEIPDDSFMRSTLQEMQEGILIDIKKIIDQPERKSDNIAIRKAKQLYNSCKYPYYHECYNFRHDRIQIMKVASYKLYKLSPTFPGMHESFRTSHYSDYKYLPIYNVLTRGDIGQWPILVGDTWNETEYDLSNLLGKLFSHQVQSIFELYVTPDDTENPKYLFQLYKGDPAMAKAFFLNSTNPDYIKYVRSYKRLLLEAVLILSHGKQGSPGVYADVDAILEFEIKFAKLAQKTRCNFDGFDLEIEDDEDYGRITLGEIHEKVPQIDWTLIIQNIYDNLNIKKNVSQDSLVYYHCSEYFPELVKLLGETDKRTVTNYLIWRFVFRYMPFLGNKFQGIWIEFMKDVPDTNEEKLYLSRWKQCSSIISDGFGMAMSHIYVKQNYKNSTEVKVREMIQYLKQAYSIIILEQEWLDDDFKKDLIEKLMNMGSKIGFPHHILDSYALAKEYDGLDFSDDHPFLVNILKLRRYEVYKEIRKVDMQVDKENDWLVQPLIANAFHSPSLNEIVIPLGLLREPMFSEEYPMYLNFANLGIVIAHELTHGFDQVGRHYDKDGNFTPSWWPDNVLSGFKKQAICFIDHYAKFEMPIGSNVDGNETLGENICDASALRQAWLAYQLWTQDHGAEKSLPGVNLTIPQIFYTTYGQIWCEVLNKEGYETYLRDSHAPGEFRTEGVIQNNKDFANIFECQKGTRMNPYDEKCYLWS